MINITQRHNNKKNIDIENVLFDNNKISKANGVKKLIEKITLEPKGVKYKFKLTNNKNNEKFNLKRTFLPKFEVKTENQILNNKEQNNTPIQKCKTNITNNDINVKTRIFKPFMTSVNFKSIQTNDNTKNTNTSTYISKKNNKVSFGKSLNEVLINNINEAIMKKGTIIQKLKRKNYSTIIYRSGYSNYNDYDLHKKIFDQKLIEIYENYQKNQKIHRKERIEELLPSFEKRSQEMKSRIPLYIKGYKKRDLDIFYTRNICDLDYQRYYNKNQINLNEILENHNKYNRKDYLSGNIPFFLLTKSVFKPMFRKSFSQSSVHKKYNKNRNINKMPF